MTETTKLEARQKFMKKKMSYKTNTLRQTLKVKILFRAMIRISLNILKLLLVPDFDKILQINNKLQYC